MNEERQSSISAALQSYRNTVQDLNLSALRIALASVEEKPALPDVKEDEVRQLRLELLRSEYRIRLDSSDITVSDIRDFLSGGARELFIATCSLDGVNHGTVDVKEREAWFADLWDRVSNTEGISNRPKGLPEDLKYLSTLVRGICGPGLPGYREISRLSFLTDLSLLQEYDDHRVDVPLSQGQMNYVEFNALPLTWVGWEIAVGDRTGDGPQAWSGGSILFCRQAEWERSEWLWRYGIKDEAFESELCDSLEIFFGVVRTL